jgi:hypothetical protein
MRDAGIVNRITAGEILPDLLEELQKTLPPIWLGTRTDELTGPAICWGTVQNLRARREAPDDAFARAGNRVLVIRDRFLPWWISTLSEARRPPVVVPPRRRRRGDGGDESARAAVG